MISANAHLFRNQLITFSQNVLSLFDEHRTDLFRIVNPILLRKNIALNDDEVVHLLLYGHEKLKLCENKNVLKATVYKQNASFFHTIASVTFWVL